MQIDGRIIMIEVGWSENKCKFLILLNLLTFRSKSRTKCLPKLVPPVYITIIKERIEKRIKQLSYL